MSCKHQELYYAELRLKRMTDQYLFACHTLKDFQHCSTGIELAKRMSDLSKEIEELRLPESKKCEEKPVFDKQREAGVCEVCIKTYCQLATPCDRPADDPCSCSCHQKEKCTACGFPEPHDGRQCAINMDAPKPLTETHTVEPEEKCFHQSCTNCYPEPEEPKPECDHQWNYGGIFAWCSKCLKRDREYEAKHCKPECDCNCNDCPKCLAREEKQTSCCDRYRVNGKLLHFPKGDHPYTSSLKDVSGGRTEIYVPEPKSDGEGPYGTSECEECGIAEKCYGKFCSPCRRTIEKRAMMNARIMDMEAEEKMFRRELMDFINHRIVACLKPKQYKTALEDWQRLSNKFL